LGELDPSSATSAIFNKTVASLQLQVSLKHAGKQCNKCHGKVMEKVIQKSWNVMEFGFENCVGTLSCGNQKVLRSVIARSWISVAMCIAYSGENC